MKTQHQFESEKNTFVYSTTLMSINRCPRRRHSPIFIVSLGYILVYWIAVVCTFGTDNNRANECTGVRFYINLDIEVLGLRRFPIRHA